MKGEIGKKNQRKLRLLKIINWAQYPLLWSYTYNLEDYVSPKTRIVCLYKGSFNFLYL